MNRLAIALSSALEAPTAASALAAEVESALGGPAHVAGAFVCSTAAAGLAGERVGGMLAARWPGAELIGTSFRGLVLDGRVWQGEPAVAVLAWTEGEGAPIPIVCEAGERDPDVLAKEICSASGRAEAGPGDLVLLFPDALGTPALVSLLERFTPAFGGPALAGAAATGADEHTSAAWAMPADPGESEILLGLLLPGDRHRGGGDLAGRVQCVGGSRIASPWLEITSCRSHWIDGLEGEPPVAWIRRQLGLEDGAPVEPHLDRLLVRLASRGSVAADGEPAVFEERYVSGLDARRGSISVMGVFARGDRFALALPDPGLARDELRRAVDALTHTPLILQFGCSSRGEALHGDPDLESAIVAHRAGSRRVLGFIAPFQLGTDSAHCGRFLVHSTVLAACGPLVEETFSSSSRSE